MSFELFENEDSFVSRREFVRMLFVAASVGGISTEASAKEIERKIRFVDGQVKEILHIISSERFTDVLRNRYLASVLYYSERFLNQVAASKDHSEVPLMIISRVRRALTHSFRDGAFSHLESTVNRHESPLSERERKPLGRFSFGHGPNHADAVDLFTREGASVYAYMDGLVLLADTDWRPGDPYSAASQKGGNSVITYNPVRREFCRYAHLREVQVSVGGIVTAGSRIGTVGNTGTNASRPGHGGHLHFEINQHNHKSRINSVVTADVLRRRLQALT